VTDPFVSRLVYFFKEVQRPGATGKSPRDVFKPSGDDLDSPEVDCKSLEIDFERLAIDLDRPQGDFNSPVHSFRGPQTGLSSPCKRFRWLAAQYG
jgi:hypothetical protein